MTSGSSGRPMPRSGPRPRADSQVPAGFRIARELPVGRHPLLAAFPGLDRLETATRHEPDQRKRVALHAETWVELVAEDVWMYVAPEKVPADARGRWNPVPAGGKDCIVIGEEHFRRSPPLIVFLDIFHELCHIRQRHDGRELWDRRFSYGQRPTEVEAYKFVIDEARRFGVADPVLREYLKVDWMDDADYRHLLAAVGVPVA